jgi:hypothetical protein
VSNPDYIVGVGETVRDVIINSSGSFGNGSSNANWDVIATGNEWDDWTPSLSPGESIAIPDNVYIDTNTQRNRQTYPANNTSVIGYLTIILAVWGLLINNWILLTGFWNDGGIWIDTDNWTD